MNPSPAEQDRIAKLLDEADNLWKLRIQADRRATGLLPALFHELLEQSATHPKSWSVIRVEEAGKVQPGRHRALKSKAGNFTRPCVGAVNLTEAKIDVRNLAFMDFDKRDFERYRLQYGDILLEEGQDPALVGRPAMWRNEVPNCCFQNTLLRFQPDKEKVLPEFALAVFLIYFREGRFANPGKTSGAFQPGASRLAKMPFPLPPLALQQEFAARTGEIRAMEAGQAASRQRLDDLFRSLLRCAFDGEL